MGIEGLGTRYPPQGGLGGGAPQPPEATVVNVWLLAGKKPDFGWKKIGFLLEKKPGFGWKAPYHFTATTALMNFLLFVALTLLHTKP